MAVYPKCGVVGVPFVGCHGDFAKPRDDVGEFNEGIFAFTLESAKHERNGFERARAAREDLPHGRGDRRNTMVGDALEESAYGASDVLSALGKGLDEDAGLGDKRHQPGESRMPPCTGLGCEDFLLVPGQGDFLSSPVASCVGDQRRERVFAPRLADEDVEGVGHGVNRS